MIKITPALLCKNYSDIEEGISSVYRTTDSIQIDFTDGIFTKNKTWPYVGTDFANFKKMADNQESFFGWETVDFEFDLMIDQPELKLDDFISLSPSMVVIHLESVKDFSLLLEKINHYKGIVKFGASFDDDLEISKLDYDLSIFDYVQLMGIDEIGVQGALPEPRVHYNLQYLKNKFPEMPLSVDGGVNLMTALELVKSGATRLVIGSAIFNSDLSPSQAIKNFQDLLK